MQVRLPLAFRSDRNEDQEDFFQHIPRLLHFAPEWLVLIRPVTAMGYQRRHVVSNIMFVSQSEDIAQVRANGVLLTTNSGADPKVVTSMAYEGTFVKRDGVWKIQKWVVRTDTNQNYDQSNLPEGVRTSADVDD